MPLSPQSGRYHCPGPSSAATHFPARRDEAMPVGCWMCDRSFPLPSVDAERTPYVMGPSAEGLWCRGEPPETQGASA